MGVCLAMAFSFHEDDVMAFIVSTLLTFGGAFIFLFFGHREETDSLLLFHIRQILP